MEASTKTFSKEQSLKGRHNRFWRKGPLEHLKRTLAEENDEA
jgi:hypothetical protein